MTSINSRTTILVKLVYSFEEVWGKLEGESATVPYRWRRHCFPGSPVCNWSSWSLGCSALPWNFSV